MSVYVYSDRQRLNMIGCLEDDGSYYDKDINILNSMPQTFYGYVDRSGIVYKDRQRYEPVGAFWDYDNCVYRDYRVVSSSIASERPIAYVYNDEVYSERPASGHYPTGTPILYLEGSGNYGHAAAAALLLNGGLSSARSDDVWYPKSEVDHSTWSGGGSGPVAPDDSWKPLLIFAAIAVVAFWLIFGKSCAEKDRKYDERENKRHEEVLTVRNETWENDYTWGKEYRKYFGEIATKTTFIEYYTVKNDCNLCISIYPENSDVEIEAYFRDPNGDEFLPGSTVSAYAGDEYKIVVHHRGGAGFFRIDVVER